MNRKTNGLCVHVLTHEESRHDLDSLRLWLSNAGVAPLILDNSGAQPFIQGLKQIFNYLVGILIVDLSSAQHASLGRKISKRFFAIASFLIQNVLLLHKQTRTKLEAQVNKASSVRIGQIRMWHEAANIDCTGPCLFLEDDAKPNADALQVIEMAIGSLGPKRAFALEVSESFSLRELGASLAIDAEFELLSRKILRLNPGFSNTTCAVLYSKHALDQLLRFVTSEKVNSRYLRYIPIDWLVDFGYKTGALKFECWHIIPGLFDQASDFRRRLI